jgi:mono/diheme cytochrome c family protein
MKSVAITLCCIALALVAVACTETAPSTNSTPSTAAASPTATKPLDPLAVGRENFQKNCEACHGPAGEGGPAKVDNKEIKVPSLKSEHAMKKTDDQITKVINNGDGPMPGFKDKMTPEQITELVKFVRAEIQKK